ncbi:MAG: hypothetical protein ABSB91_04175 [Sedimentisphaerales bacterium]
MANKNSFRLSGFFIVLFILQPVYCWAITTDELISKCQWIESSIRDVSAEYEWYIIPPYTPQEIKNETGLDTLASKDGVLKNKIFAARFFDANIIAPLHSPYRWQVMKESSFTLIAEKGQSWDASTKESYDGKIHKELNEGGWPSSSKSGLVKTGSWEDFKVKTKESPIGFSIFRFEIDGVDDTLLSMRLRERADKNLLRMGSEVQKVGDFNTICVELLLPLNSDKVTIRRIYFSTEHNYTPVKFEYLNPVREGGSKLAQVVEVQTLQSVGDGLWLPTSGTSKWTDDEHERAFQVKGKILINQGLTDKIFDIKFPVGIRVSDQITGREYKVEDGND